MNHIPCCVYCQHFRCDAGHAWSSWTIEDPSTHCVKGNFYNGAFEEEMVMDLIKRAKSCKDYELADKVKQEIKDE